MIDLDKLKEPFPKEKVSWRAGKVTKAGDKALALAYIDARDVYDRLDDVCGPNNWQCRYTQESDRTFCEIGIYFGEQGWVWKSNAAGDTQVEAQKGAASDALKRAAVAWGIGRYLYDFDQVWVPCMSWDDRGKKKFKRFTADPWSGVRNPSHFLPDDDPDEINKPVQDHSAKPAQQSQQSAPSGTTALEAAEACQAVADIATQLGLQNNTAFVMAMQHLRNARDVEGCTRSSMRNAYNLNVEAVKKHGGRPAFDAYRNYSAQLAGDLPEEMVAAE